MIDKIEKLNLEAVIVDTEDTQKAISLWKECIFIINSNRRNNTINKKHIFYIKGYVYYMLWARTGRYFRLSERYLQNSLKICSNYYMTVFYLSSLYFEGKNYKKAKLHLIDIKDNLECSFLENDKYWMYAKSLEMLTSIYIIKNQESTMYPSLDLTISAYIKLEKPLSIAPLTISKIFFENHTSIETPDRIKLLIKQLIEISDSEDLFKKHFQDFYE